MIWNKKRITSVLAALVILSALITVGAAHSFTNITLSPPSPARLCFFEDVVVTFDYSTEESDDVIIRAMPFSGGSENPSYNILIGKFPGGNGSGAVTFTISTEGPMVDEVRLQMWADHYQTMLLESIIPVEYRFGECPEEAPAITPVGIIALVSALSAIAAVAIVRKRR